MQAIGIIQVIPNEGPYSIKTYFTKYIINQDIDVFAEYDWEMYRYTFLMVRWKRMFPVAKGRETANNTSGSAEF